MARDTASHSSIAMVPSGRSAMICTVQPSSPETRTRTNRNPRSISTGAAIAAMRDATPVSAIRRGSARMALSIGPVSTAGVASVVMVRAACLSSRCRLADPDSLLESRIVHVVGFGVEHVDEVFVVDRKRYSAWHSELVPGRQVFPVLIEDLYAGIGSIAHKQTAAFVHGNAMRRPELARCVSGLP